jgi:hypothetical protein
MVKVAQEVIAYCSQCKMDLAAIVVAMKGDQILRVECKTCRKKRGYKAPKGIDEPGKAPPVKKTTRGARTEAGERVDRSVGAEWKKALLQYKDRPLNTYSAKMAVGVGDRIAHPTFGEGVVMKPIHPNKAEILFEMDIKVLIVGGART